MKTHPFLAHFGLPAHVHAGPVWWFIALALLVLFVTLVVAESAKPRDK